MKISEHIETMEEPYRSQVRSNFENDRYPDVEVITAHEALDFAFCWRDAPEGFTYWCNYYMQIYKL